MTGRVPAPGAPTHLSLAGGPGDIVRSSLVAAFEGIVLHAGELRRSPELAFAAGWISAGSARADTRAAWPKAWRSLAKKERRFW